MPPIRSITCADDLIRFTDFRGNTRTLLASAIPAGNNTIAKVENFVNNTWIPANVTGYQMRVHVFSLAPLRVTVGTWDIGLSIPANWWSDA